MWEGIFNIIIALGAGLIIAFVTTFYLKKKDEITRVAGVILEKRVNSEQEILDFLEDLAFQASSVASLPHKGTGYHPKLG